MRAGLLLLCLLLPLSAAAQTPEADLHPSKYRNAFGAWGGLAFASPDWWGAARGQEVYLLGLRYRHTMTRSAIVSLSYTFDLIPAAAVTKTPTRTTRVCCASASDKGLRTAGTVIEVVEPGTAYGVGLAPLGLQLDLFSDHPVFFSLGAAGGLLVFDRDVPRLDTRSMNFTATLHAGLHVALLDAFVLTVGYKFHHLSNANTAPYNPGLDSNMFFLGWMSR